MNQFPRLRATLANLAHRRGISWPDRGDTRAPGEYRSDTGRNSEAWLRAFDVKPTDRPYLKPEQRVRIW